MALSAIVPSPSPAQWPLDAGHLQADQVWRINRGSGVTVAVVDTGVDARHVDLAGRVRAGAGFVGVTGDDGRTDVSDDSHGTSMAGIIAGTGLGGGMAGLAPEATILPVRVSLNSAMTPLAVAKGIFYAVDHGAAIINVSAETVQPDPNLKAAVDYAIGRNAIVVASAGNSGQHGNPVMYPASFPGVVSVSGVDAGNRLWSGSESGPQITLAAPAADVYSTSDNGGYLRGNGTSYAAPFVAAAAALVWSHYPRLTAPEVVRQLIDTADHQGDAVRTDLFGFGIVDPLRAVTAPPTTAAGLPTPAASPSGPNSFVIGTAAAAVVLVAVGIVLFLRRRRAKVAP
jgi:type VII secretion-associated serine protease mycosin